MEKKNKNGINLEELFDTYYNRVYSFTFFRVRNVHDTEDIVSDTFYKAAKNIRRYDEEKASLSTWLFTIALNEMRSYYRKRRDVLSLEDTENITALDDIEKSVLSNERAEEMYAAISQLNERQRNIVLMRYYGEMSNREIALVLHLTETNVETILSRAKKTLKNLLEECEISTAAAYKDTEAVNKEAIDAR